MPNPEFGAIFDWDGVVMDSAKAHEASWEALGRELGRTLPEGHFIRGFGKRNESIFSDIFHWDDPPEDLQRYSLRKEELYREILGQSPLEPLPGVRALLEDLRRSGIPCVVGSSTSRLNIEHCIRQLKLEGFFADQVTGDDVKRGKPDPEVFLKAAAAMGLPPERCVVFEDSLSGIQAGLSGGMKVVAVATTNPLEAIGHAHWAVERLTAVNVGGLRNLWR